MESQTLTISKEMYPDVIWTPLLQFQPHFPLHVVGTVSISEGTPFLGKNRASSLIQALLKALQERAVLSQVTLSIPTPFFFCTEEIKSKWSSGLFQSKLSMSNDNPRAINGP